MAYVPYDDNRVSIEFDHDSVASHAYTYLHKRDGVKEKIKGGDGTEVTWGSRARARTHQKRFILFYV